MTLIHKTLWYSKMVEMTVYPVSPLKKLYVEFSSGLYFCIKYFYTCINPYLGRLFFTSISYYIFRACSKIRAVHVMQS